MIKTSKNLVLFLILAKHQIGGLFLSPWENPIYRKQKVEVRKDVLKDNCPPSNKGNVQDKISVRETTKHKQHSHKQSNILVSQLLRNP